MSQPCSAVELLLIDISALDAPEVVPLLELAGERGIPRGCLSHMEPVASDIEQLDLADLFDFWFAAEDGRLPIDRALKLVPVDAGRALLIADDPEMLEQGADAGLQTTTTADPDLERRFG